MKNYEKRIEREIEKKQDLLLDLETPVALKLYPMKYHKERLITCKDVTIGYETGKPDVLKQFSFELMQGERAFLHGTN